MGRIYRLYVWPINNMSAAYNLCVSNIQSEPMHHVFVCATHISKCSGPRRSTKSNFICRDKFIKCHISQFWPRNGSPWLATGSYFVSTEPRPVRSFWKPISADIFNLFFKYFYINFRPRDLFYIDILPCGSVLTKYEPVATHFGPETVIVGRPKTQTFVIGHQKS